LMMTHFVTYFSLNEVKDLVYVHKKNPEKRKGQKKIAENMTLLVHGREGLEMAQKATR